MKQKLETIYETNIVHNSFLDKDSIIQAMVESYNLGKQELINWLSEKDYLSDDKKSLLKEYNNLINNIKKMTNEEFTLEILMEAESLGIRKEVLELSHKIKQENEFMDINTSIEKAFHYMKSKLQKHNNV